jgi:hypothetical protein
MGCKEKNKKAEMEINKEWDQYRKKKQKIEGKGGRQKK